MYHQRLKHQKLLQGELDKSDHYMKRLFILLLFISDSWGFPLPLDETPVRGFWISAEVAGQGYDLHRQAGT